MPKRLCISTILSQQQVSSTPPSQLTIQVPKIYPQAILWWFDNCKTDPNIHTFPGNKSHLPMQLVVQHMDGTLITTNKWKVIHELAVTIVSTHLHCLPIRHLPSSAVCQLWKMAFYQCYFLKEWQQAVRELEVLAPLLSYCGTTWKAEKMLQCILQEKPTPPQPSSHPHLHLSSHSCPSSSLSHSDSHTSTPAFAPPSSVGSSCSIPSSINNPSKPASSHSVQVSPHCAALMLGVQPCPVLSTTNKAVKAKHRQELSPVQLNKQPRGSDGVASSPSAGKGLPHLLKQSWLNPLLRA